MNKAGENAMAVDDVLEKNLKNSTERSDVEKMRKEAINEELHKQIKRLE